MGDDDASAGEPRILTIDTTDVSVMPGQTDAGPIALVTVGVTNLSDEACDEGRLVLSIEAQGGGAESHASAWLPWWAIDVGATTSVAGQVQLDPGDWQVQVQLIDVYTNFTLKDFGWVPVHIDGPTHSAAAYDDSQPHLMSVFIDGAEVMGLECRIHYTVTNASDHAVPAGMKVAATLAGAAGGETSQAYHYTEALPPYVPEQRYLTLELTDLQISGGASATATVVVDPLGPSEVYDEVTLEFNGTGPVTVTR